MKEAEVSDPKETDETTYKNNISKEVFLVRALLREKKYLLTPFKAVTHVSLDGTKELSNELVDFTTIAMENFEEYSLKIIDNVPYTQRIVYITNEEKNEHEKVEGLTKQNILKDIYTIIEGMTNDDRQLYMSYFQKEVKSKNKSAYIDFLKDISDLPTDKDDIYFGE